MKLPRPFRCLTALIMLFSMLFMQYAVASYACPGMEMGQAAAGGDQSMQDMPGCRGMDTQQPSLCHAHDQVGHQSLDKPELPHVQPFVAATMTQVVSDVEVTYRSISSPPDSPHLARTTAPPLSIRHCCFRI